MIRVMLADDEAAVRRGLKMRLKLVPDIQVVGEAGNGEEATRLAQELKPDVVVMDVSMPRLDGIQATEALRKLIPSIAVVILTLHADKATQARAEAAGAVAFLAKGGNEQSLIAAIRQAAGRAQGIRPTGSIPILVPFPEAGERHLRITVGACRLSIKPTEDKNWITGTSSDPTGLLPVKITNDGPVTKLTQEYNSAAGFGSIVGIPHLELGLGKSKPYALTIESGANESNLDLGGLPLNRLTIRQGAGKYAIDFSARNPEVMNTLSIIAGACNLEMFNLSNANLAEMTIEGGAAAYKFDFSGNLQRDGRVRISTALSSVEIAVPASTAAQIVTESVIGSLDIGDGFTKKSGAFCTEAAVRGKRPVLTIHATNTFGSLRLRVG